MEDNCKNIISKKYPAVKLEPQDQQKYIKEQCNIKSLQEQLETQLNADQLQLFSSIIDSIMSNEYFKCEKAIEAAFKRGAQLMMEIMED